MTPEARQCLEGLMAQAPNELLKPLDVVRAAEPLDSPLHRYFTWDNAVAAEQYRLVQARVLLRSVYVINPGELHTQPTMGYVSLLMDRSQPGGGYRPIATVMASDALREELMYTALQELRGWLRRHQRLERLVTDVAKAANLPLPHVVEAHLVAQGHP